MTKTTTIIVMIAALTLGTALTVHAQTPSTAPTDPAIFVSVSGGGQFQSREFTETTTFTLFNEAGTVTANQTIGSGFVFDASVGYRVWRRLSVAVGVSTFRGSGQAAAIVAVPESVDLRQADDQDVCCLRLRRPQPNKTAINFQAVWIKPLTDKLD